MSGLKDRVLALIGRRRKEPGLAGWARVDADHVVRGWVVDSTRPGRRLDVEVRIDGERIGQAVADRFDDKLVELGHGDGRHAFQCLVPDRYRDGRAHAFEVVEPASGYQLMSKADSFTVPRSAEAPRLAIQTVDEVRGLAGTLRGGQYAHDVQLELWSAGERLPVGPTTWRWRGGAAAFSLSWPEGTLYALAPDAALGGPGMYESGVATPLADALRLNPELTADGFTVTVQGRLQLDPAAGGAIEVVDEGGTVLASAVLQDGVAALPAAAAVRRGARLQLRAARGEAPLLRRPLDLKLGPLVRNDNFESWSGQAPANWELGDGVTAARGFYAFPEAADLPGLAGGDIVSLKPGAGATLLSQDLPAWASLPGLRLELGLVARSSQPVRASLALLAEDGEVLHAKGLDLAQPWAWDLMSDAIDVGDRPLARVELRIAAGTDPEAEIPEAEIQVAALTVGGPARAGSLAAERMWGLPPNLVENGDLADWPRGLSMQVGAGRSECAGAWFVQNRKAATPVRVAASTAGGRPCLAVAATEVPEYCRLEARLHPDTLRAGPRLRVGFQAQIPSEAPADVQSGRAYSVIERLFLLRRGLKATGTGAAPGAEVLATVTRRTAIGREPQAFEFDVDLTGCKPGDLEAAELFLAFDFNDPFAILLRDVTVTAAPAEAQAQGGLALEDPAITAQAATLKGLGAWLSPELVTPGAAFEVREAADGPPLHWSPAPAGAPTVEVVVCVHDAADETLACLRSLAASSSLPHTVRLIDDASGADTRNRLLAFIADKPWMRMISQAENRGYTASANLGVRGSAADWVVLLNSDTVVTPGWIEGLLECAASDPQIAFVGPLSNAASYQSLPELKDRQGRWKVNVLPPGWSPARMARFVAEESRKGFPRVPLLNGFCTLIRRDAFMALGGFNEAAFPRGYGEENDLCVRAAAAGYGLAVADHVYVYHAKSASFGSARRAELQKAAGRALAELHPDVDFTALGDRVREAAALVELRAKVRALYEAQG